ncbi:MAG: hypothetical protein ACYS9X_02600 [Planctomycetota bacterium]|jgi:hypothetical protein
MTTERERIEKLLAEGKVSAEEAERLRAALDRAEREETHPPPGAREAIVKPRLSRLALAGALGLPAAGIAFLLVAGLSIAFGVRDDRAAEGAFLVAAAVALTGVGLSIAGRVAIRRAPDELTGLRAARLGIIVPVVTGAVVLVVIVVVGIVTDYYNYRHGQRMREQALLQRDEEVLQHLWQQLCHAVTSRKSGDMPEELFHEMLDQLLEPEWVGAIVEESSRGGGPGTQLWDELERLVAAPGSGHFRWSRCTLEQSGEGPHRESVSGTFVLTDRRKRKDYHFRVVKVEEDWRFARAPFEETPAEPGPGTGVGGTPTTRAVTRTEGP